VGVRIFKYKSFLREAIDPLDKENWVISKTLANIGVKEQPMAPTNTEKLR
jgi:hypothetical protein